ncbi:DUF1186 domain-containing protein [Undibacterium sp. SXout20W]|uniref:DUF1186 domain-containing protein n=1 Tax=Undibacterium sp. SXout20W TaxID=3413051 RepID=UPI003BF39423
MSQAWLTLREQLEYFSTPFPRAALAFAEENKDEVTPYLVEVLVETAKKPAITEDGEYMLHMYSMHLLASWRVTEAYRPMLAIGGFPDEIIESMMGDVVTETYGRCLASVCDGNVHLLQQRFTDEFTSIWSRSAALIAWQVRVIAGENDRTELIEFISQAGEQLAEQRRHADEGDAVLLETIVDVATALCATEMAEQVNRWFAEKLLDPQISDQDWFNEHIRLDFNASRALELEHGKGYIHDVEKEMGWWSGFQDEKKPSFRNTYTQHTIRKEPKIGRNDPCPCGSGKKYKKCHGVNI